MTDDNFLAGVQRYYDEKIRAHGATPLGADWNSAESQRLRFAQLLKLVDRKMSFSINDYGCGYGALSDYLRDEGYTFDYRGYDISSAMIAEAKEIHAAMSQAAFVCEESGLSTADYTIASGIFNVKLNTSEAEWKEYMLRTLAKIDALSLTGFAFNVLTKYSDREFVRDDLYYADPLFLFEHCRAKFSRLVSLIHDYPLYEFTIVVRKK